jgi:uncharacterized membrane protein
MGQNNRLKIILIVWMIVLNPAFLIAVAGNAVWTNVATPAVPVRMKEKNAKTIFVARLKRSCR